MNRPSARAYGHGITADPFTEVTVYAGVLHATADLLELLHKSSPAPTPTPAANWAGSSPTSSPAPTPPLKQRSPCTN